MAGGKLNDEVQNSRLVAQLNKNIRPTKLSVEFTFLYTSEP